jgi:hypothetical protein
LGLALRVGSRDGAVLLAHHVLVIHIPLVVVPSTMSLAPASAKVAAEPAESASAASSGVGEESTGLEGGAHTRIVVQDTATRGQVGVVFVRSSGGGGRAVSAVVDVEVAELACAAEGGGGEGVRKPSGSVMVHARAVSIGATSGAILATEIAVGGVGIPFACSCVDGRGGTGGGTRRGRRTARWRIRGRRSGGG